MNSSSIFQTLDWVVLGIYFLILIVVAVWVALQRNKNTEDYFLAGRNVGWFVIGASILLQILALNMLLDLRELDFFGDPISSL